MERATINKKVGKAIHHALRRKGITQAQLAEMIGTTQRSISAYVRGEQQPSLETLVVICKALKLNLNQILHLEEKKTSGVLMYEEEFMQILDEIPLEKRESFLVVVKALKDLTK